MRCLVMLKEIITLTDQDETSNHNYGACKVKGKWDKVKSRQNDINGDDQEKTRYKISWRY